MQQTKKLSGQAKLLIAMNTLFLFSVALSNTFVNVYLWKIKNDYTMIGLFNLFQYLTMPLLFFLSGILSRKADRIVTIRLGVLVMALFYFVVLLLGKASSEHIIWLGMLLGTGSGLYWFGFNVMLFEITSPENRDNFNGTNGFYASGTGMIAPLLSGWFLSRMTELTGYRWIFSLSLAIFLSAVIVSFFIRGRKAKGKMRFKKAFRDSFQPTHWRNVMVAHGLLGIREGVFAFLIGLFVYITTSSEFKLGIYTFLTSGVSLAAYMAAGKWMTKERRKRSLLLGAVMLSIVILPMLWSFRYASILILGVGSALFYPLFIVPLTSVTFDVIGENEEKAAMRVEYIVVREWMLNLGRVLGIAVFLWLVAYTQKPLYLSLFLFLCSALLPLGWFFMKRIPAGIAVRKERAFPTVFHDHPFHRFGGEFWYREKARH